MADGTLSQAGSMNTERIVSLAVVAVVVLAIGLSASTLESSMSTEPEDAIDLDNEAFPLGAERGEQIQAATQRLHDEYTDPTDQDEASATEMRASDTGVSAAVPAGGTTDEQGRARARGPGRARPTPDSTSSRCSSAVCCGSGAPSSSTATGGGWTRSSPR
ncbi:hypothetical protein ACFQH8_03285 [Halomicroarcula sp. GCM10025710]